MRLRDLLGQTGLRLSLLTGKVDLDRRLTLAYTTDLLDPTRYLTGGELVLTGLMWRRTPADSEQFVAALSRAGVGALGAGEALLGCVPADLVRACQRHRIPLLAVPADVSFREITELVNAVPLAEQGMVAALAAGAELADVWPADLQAWVLTPTGRVVAGGPLADETIAADAMAANLAAAFLAADTLPTTVRYAGREFQIAAPASAGAGTGAGAGIDTGTGIGTWTARHAARFVAGATGVPLDALVSLVALDQARQERALQLERRLAAQLIEVLAGPAETAELSAALHACGLSLVDSYVVVVASLADATPAWDALGELVFPSRVVAADGSRSVAVVATTDAAGFLAGLRAATQRLTAAPGAVAVRIGVSQPAGPARLPAALVEATHAHSYAQAQAHLGLARVVGGADLAPRDLLLAGLPNSARDAFAGRLLGPLVAHDANHRTDLVRTLRTFLDCDGSWTRCAAVLHLHVNTLRYRIRRISDLTGCDLDRFADRVDLYLALRLSTMPGDH